ncbi:MAG: ubiquinol-cytochrome C reductase, iron-sulfur subunit [Granulosicoccaceae bacterium]
MLRVATKLMVAVGVLAFVGLLISSLSSSESVSTDLPSMLVDTSGIDHGQVEYTVWHGRPILIYRRTVDDRQVLRHVTRNLVDAESKHSIQPDFPNLPLRSLSPEWFVAFSSGTDMGCPIELHAASTEPSGELVAGRFSDTCRGSSYDLAGRVYSDQPATKNLAVPPYSIKPDGNILLGGVL